MFHALAAFALGLTVQTVPLVVAFLSLSRLFRSRSANALLYALSAGLAVLGALDAGGLLNPGRHLDAGTALFALTSLPLWLIVRAAGPRSPVTATDLHLRPVFASERAAATRGELRRRPIVAT